MMSLQIAARARVAHVSTLRCALAFAPRVRHYGTPVDLPIPKKSKVWDSVDEAILDVKSGDIVLSGAACRCASVCICGVTDAGGVLTV